MIVLLEAVLLCWNDSKRVHELKTHLFTPYESDSMDSKHKMWLFGDINRDK
jgi:hypothetical protein